MSSSEPCPVETPFGSNDVRLSLAQWAVAVLLAALVLVVAPRLLERREDPGSGPDFRIPYSLGNDYWMFERTSRRACADGKILLVGDSVVWGHYVGSAQTLSHYLNASAGAERFANCGVDGSHPVALAGLLDRYGGAIAGAGVIVHLNLLWMSSERHDLRTKKEFAFNHPDLVPQFFPEIPCFRRSFQGRLDTVVGRYVPFGAWAKHVRYAYFEGSDIPAWTLAHPYECPAARFARALPSPDEPPSPPPVAKPWTEQQLAKFDAQWVDLESSLQWRFFREALESLRRKGNRVFVVLGPFNEHMLTAASLEAYAGSKAAAAAWLDATGIPYVNCTVLPSELFADASHPLAEGYASLARQLLGDERFRDFSGAAGAEGGKQ